MREIKFRWFKHGEMSYTFDGWREDICINEAFEYCKNEKIPVMQYTGLKDKNGKEIYEGDILILFDHYGQRWPDSEVMYSDYWTGFGVSDGGAWYRLGDFDTKIIEVIGNIYENPELLK